MAGRLHIPPPPPGMPRRLRAWYVALAAILSAIVAAVPACPIQDTAGRPLWRVETVHDGDTVTCIDATRPSAEDPAPGHRRAGIRPAARPRVAPGASPAKLAGGTRARGRRTPAISTAGCSARSGSATATSTASWSPKGTPGCSADSPPTPTCSRPSRRPARPAVACGRLRTRSPRSSGGRNIRATGTSHRRAARRRQK